MCTNGHLTARHIERLAAGIREDLMQDYAKILAAELSLEQKYVEGAMALIEEGNTIPFIARYRKEATGSMDDQVLRQLGERLDYLKNLEKRREEILHSLTELGLLDEKLTAQAAACTTMTALEDFYRPYRPKRKTRAGMAKARGLQPLAELILQQKPGLDPCTEAAKYLSDEVPDVQAALAGASDIIAEAASDSAEIRQELRDYYRKNAEIVSSQVKEEDSVYAQYYSYEEAVSRIPGHRILALDRGEKDGFLKVNIRVDGDRAAEKVCRRMLAGRKASPSGEWIRLACLDAYGRLIHPSLSNELRQELTDRACEGAIRVFGDNLRQLLLQPPIRGRVVMGLDPGYRMGCKVAVVDATGRVLDTNVIYPVPQFKKVEQAKTVVKAMVRRHQVELMAIGNGTAGHETEEFAAEVIRELAAESRLHLQYMVVSEAGASVYSASKLAAEEFPQFDVNLRSAVSIARRLQDPLAELVKIDPKAVGVGQYQHDMPQKRLEETLDGVVEDCVNSVGVDLNTASAPLLSRVAGITRTVAGNIVACREENGEFTSRAQLKKVKGLGPKAYEQCAGFLRIPEAKDPLDGTAVHPESYPAARELLRLCGMQPSDIGGEQMKKLPERVRKLGAEKLCEQLAIGLPTLADITAELIRPGRDVRDSLPAPLLRSDILGMEDLKAGMELTGTVRNVVDFGAFVDIGVHQDGLVHISQITDRYIRHPGEVLHVGDIVKVKVLSVDTGKKRIGLTMKGLKQT